VEEDVYSPRLVRFGTFEVDLAAGELRKSGVKLRLTGQPFQVLAILLERPGEVVTREELQKRLWPDTFVDVDHNLNTAINKIREVLGESAESPRFVETLPRRGYRFVAPVTQDSEQEPSPPVVQPTASGFGFRHGLFSKIVVAVVSLLCGIGVFFMLKRPTPVTLPSEYKQLTNFTDSAVAPSLSPDGRMVTFKRGEDAFFGSGQIYVKLLSEGEPVRLTNDSDSKYAPVFTPDGSRIAYTRVGESGWDTWSVPSLGGEPTRLLPNASALTWIADRRILFSEIRTELHMGIVSSTENRAERREIYFPANPRAMAHYAYASPDGKWVLVVEMDQTHTFHQPCRLVPIDGSSIGRQVGPHGTCTSAAWSPDGNWMYLAATVGGTAHLWRQKFPDGSPQQITFGPSQEEGVAVAPDGRSVVTSVGTRRSAIWIHNAAGEREISSESYAVAPRLSRDGTRVFYLFAQDLMLSAHVGWVASSGELRSVDLRSGKTENLLPGVLVADYDFSPDEKEVVFTSREQGGESQIWLAPLDRRTPPRPVTRSGDQVSFGADGDIIFRALEEKTNGLFRIKRDGTERERITKESVLDKFGVSPDGKWVLIHSPGNSADPNAAVLAVPIGRGLPRKICVAHCAAGWALDGGFFYVASVARETANSPERTLAIPVPAGKSLPDLPASGIDLSINGVAPHGTRVIEHVSISPGADPSTYVFTKTDLQRNLFQIPLH